MPGESIPPTVVAVLLMTLIKMLSPSQALGPFVPVMKFCPTMVTGKGGSLLCTVVTGVMPNTTGGRCVGVGIGVGIGVSVGGEGGNSDLGVGGIGVGVGSIGVGVAVGGGNVGVAVDGRGVKVTVGGSNVGVGEAGIAVGWAKAVAVSSATAFVAPSSIPSE